VGNGGVLHSFLTLAQGLGEWSALCRGCVTPRESMNDKLDGVSIRQKNEKMCDVLDFILLHHSRQVCSLP
jgi:hypothetical protein